MTHMKEMTEIESIAKQGKELLRALYTTPLWRNQEQSTLHLVALIAGLEAHGRMADHYRTALLRELHKIQRRIHAAGRPVHYFTV